MVGFAVREATVEVTADDHDGDRRGPGCTQRERRRLGVAACRPRVVDEQDGRIISQRARGTVSAGGERVRRCPATRPAGQERFESVLGLTDDRAGDPLKRVLPFALACPGDRGDDVKPGHVDRLGDVLLVLAEESPQDGGKPRAQPGPTAVQHIARTPRPGGRTGMRWLRYGSLSSKTVATDGQAQTSSAGSADSAASRCSPSKT